MQGIEEVTDGPLLTTPDTPATSIEGGQAYVADVARWLDPCFAARSPANGSWSICAACSVRRSARTAGK